VETCHEDGESDQGSVQGHDSLGFVSRLSKEAAEDKELVMAVYSVAACAVVCWHFFGGWRFVPLAPYLPTWAGGLARMATLVPNTPLDPNWKLMTFMMCNAYLQAENAWQPHKLLTMGILYFAMHWPILAMAERIYYFVSGAPPGSYGGNVTRRYMIMNIILCQLAFACVAKLSKHGQKVSVLLVLFASAVVHMLNLPPLFLYEIMPTWMQGPFELGNLGHDWSVQTWWLAVYLMTALYSRPCVELLRARGKRLGPVAKRLLPHFARTLLLTFIWASFKCGTSIDRSLAVFAVDAISAFVMVGLLVLSMSDITAYTSWLGEYAMGIYCGHGLWWTLKSGTRLDILHHENTSWSFCIKIRGVTILPPLNQSIEYFSGEGIIQLLVIACYVGIIIAVTGIPFHMVFVRCVSLAQDGWKWATARTASAKSEPRTRLDAGVAAASSASVDNVRRPCSVHRLSIRRNC